MRVLRFDGTSGAVRLPYCQYSPGEHLGIIRRLSSDSPKVKMSVSGRFVPVHSSGEFLDNVLPQDTQTLFTYRSPQSHRRDTAIPFALISTYEIIPRQHLLSHLGLQGSKDLTNHSKIFHPFLFVVFAGE